MQKKKLDEEFVVNVKKLRYSILFFVEIYSLKIDK